MKIFVLAMVVSSLALGQDLQRNSITLSSGFLFDQKSPCCQSDTAASLGVTYGYRLFPYLQLEAGLTGAFDPAPEERGAHYDFKPDGHFLFVPVGVKGILPLWRRRMEVSVGAGGVYENYSGSNPFFGLPSRAGWGGYFSGGLAFAIDRKHRYWIGASSRFSFVDADSSHDRYFVTTGDFGFRF